jgi:hypothetical protein
MRKPYKNRQKLSYYTKKGHMSFFCIRLKYFAGHDKIGASSNKIKMKKKKLTASARQKAKIKARRSTHKRILLHPAAIFMLLCTGVLLFGWTWKANASGPTDTVSYSVHARIPAAPLTDPAIITSPSDGQHVDAVPINVAGTCPADSYVKLYRNTIFSGVAICDSGTFTIQTDLFVGANSLQARVFNITDDEGPTGNIVTVYYDPPQLAQSSPPQSPSSSPASQPFLITSDYSYKGYLAGQTVSWQVNVSGGSTPYGFTVDWGDGHSDTYVLEHAGTLTAEHAYKSAGLYIVKLQATDGLGDHAYLQSVNIIRNSKSPSISIGGSTISLSPSQKYQWAWLAWPAYGVLLLMVLSYLLGEQQELWNLARSKQTKRRHTRLK